MNTLDLAEPSRNCLINHVQGLRDTRTADLHNEVFNTCRNVGQILHHFRTDVRLKVPHHLVRAQLACCYIKLYSVNNTSLLTKPKNEIQQMVPWRC